MNFRKRNKKVADAVSVNIMGRFWKKVIKTENCWLWIGRKLGGYGSIVFNKKRQRAHRVSFILHHGAIPSGIFVCHHCDNPACVRPDHLFLGTAKDNTQDAIVKGRIVPLMHSDETKEKIAAWHRGRTLTAETKAKISAAKKGVRGQKLSEQHRIKISTYKKAWWNAHPEKRKEFSERIKLRSLSKMGSI